MRIWGRREIRAAVEQWPEQRRYDTFAAWVQRYLPIWHAGFARYAAATNLPEAKRELYATRINEVMDRCVALRAGEPMPKARVKETDSAISTLTWGASSHFGTSPWTTTARTAALQIRSLLHRAPEPATPEWVASGVYDWAEIETRFPGDSAAMLQELTIAEREAAGSGRSDGHHLVYGRVAREWGLEREGNAVYAAVDAIMQHIDDSPEPFSIPAGFWDERSSVATDQRAASYERFHGKPRPPWLT